MDADEQPRLGRVRGVRIFQVGEWKGIPFTEKDLDDAVANHQQFSTGEHKLIDPSLGIGHKREDVLGDGKPRFGTPTNPRKEKGTCEHCGGTKNWKNGHCPYCDWVDGRPLGTQTFLTTDFEEVPEEVGHWIKNKQFTHCSAEFYPEGSPKLGNIPTKGIALGGVVLLGKTAPAVKTLPSLRAAKWEAYSDLDCEPFCLSERSFEQEQDSLVCFSEIVVPEVRNMKREELLAKLKEQGFEGAAWDNTLKTFSDEELGKLVEKTTPAPPKVVVFNEMMMGDAYKHLSGMGFACEPSHLKHEGRAHPKETIKLHHGIRDIHEKFAEAGYKHHGNGKFKHHTTGHEYHLDHDDHGAAHIHKFSEVPTSDSGDSDMTPEQIAKIVDEAVGKKLQAALDTTIKTFSDDLKKANADIVTFKTQAARDAAKAVGEARLRDLQKQGKIPANWFDNTRGGNIVDFFCELDEEAVFTFSDNGTEKKLSVRDKFLEFAEALPAKTFDPIKAAAAAGQITGGGATNEEGQFLTFAEGAGYTKEKAKEAWDKIKTLPEETRKQALVQLEFDKNNRSAA